MQKIPSYLRLGFIFLMLILVSNMVLAADGFTDDVMDVPFDSGVSALLAAGVGFGLKQFYKDWKKQGRDKTHL